MIRTVAQPSRSQIFWRALLIILIAEAVTIFVAWTLLDANIKGWLHVKSDQAIQISRLAASATDWSRIDNVPEDRESALGATYQNRLSALSDKRFSNKGGSLYLAFLDHGEEYDMYSGTEIPIEDGGKQTDGFLAPTQRGGRPIVPSLLLTTAAHT